MPLDPGYHASEATLDAGLMQGGGAAHVPAAPPSAAPPHARLGLQQRLGANLRRHVFRSARRVIVLLLADLGSFWVMRALLRAVRDAGVLGDVVAANVATVMPRGILNGWQFAAALIVALGVTGTYGAGDRRRNAARLFIACALAAALPLWMTLWTRGVDVVLVQYALTTTLVWVGVMAERLTVDRLVGFVAPAEEHAPRTVLIGSPEQCQRVAGSSGLTAQGEFRVLGFVDAGAGTAAPGALGSLRDFATVLGSTEAEAVVVCGGVTENDLRSVVEAALAAGCHVLMVPPLADLAVLEPVVVWRHGHPLIELTAPSLEGWQRALKRGVDLIGAGCGLIVASPLMLVIAAAIRLDSRGPVFFRQERVGNAGRRFRVLKFRTMYDGVSEQAHRELVTRMLNGDEATTAQAGVYKLVNDARVTRVGALLRRTSLDELPQLFNVLRGQMSLVGPRPPLPYEFDAYDHWQYDRLQVPPGITGLWQVSGRNRLSYNQMCELDVQYVRRWSLWLDLRILIKTIPVVLFNSGRAA